MKTKRQRCEWFLLCDNPAVTTLPHPVLVGVPICQRCLDKYESMAPRDEHKIEGTQAHFDRYIAGDR